ncbi:restriction endonuclease subunit S [Sporosarcina sp. FSL K6-1508]|uniref:restriction endonuclease subunit S n=1 Tax=Sporosarcina sp. FSL K6-1508 TaxID=2921553 RepID=UPI0030F76D48
MHPKLRFNAFQDRWKNTILSELMIFNNGINASKESYGHGRKFINVLDILNNNYVLYDDIIGSVSVNDKQEEANKVEYGDILFLRSSETREDVGKCTVYLDKDEYALFGGFVIRGKKNGDYYPFFLKLLLDTSSARNQISSRAGGSTRYNISQSILSSVGLSMPSISEQQKIADFFALLDHRIEQQQEKVEAWREYKKGMMQKIFSRELRFKDGDGQEFPEWEVTQLKKIVSTFSGGTPSSKQRSFYTGDIPFIRSGEISQSTTELFINSEGLESSSAKLVRKGDLLYALYGATSGEVAISKMDGAINQAILCIRTEESKHFMLHYLTLMKESILSTYLQGGQGNLSAQIIKEITISLPLKEEQEKIANFLSALDIKVENEEEKLRCLQEQKTGFMQQMFI